MLNLYKEIRKAVIAAGGRGTRLTEKTGGKCPKGLIDICDRPILSYQLEAISRNGINDVHISFGDEYFIGVFDSFIRKKLVPEINYNFSVHENDSLNTFKTKEAVRFVGNKPFIFSIDDLFYTDTVLKTVLNQYNEKDCSIVLKSPLVEDKNRVEFILKDNYVVSWKENISPPWVVGPVLILDEKANKLFLEETKRQYPRKIEFLKACIENNTEVYAIQQPEPLININRINDYHLAEKLIRRIKY